MYGMGFLTYTSKRVKINSDVHTGNKPCKGGNDAVHNGNFRTASNIYNCDKCSETFVEKPSFKSHKYKRNDDSLETFLVSKGKHSKMQEKETPFSCKDCDFKCIGMKDMVLMFYFITLSQ